MIIHVPGPVVRVELDLALQILKQSVIPNTLPPWHIILLYVNLDMNMDYFELRII